MTNIIDRYYDENLQHWVDVYKSHGYVRRPKSFTKLTHRMKGSERKFKQEDFSVEAHLREETKRFIAKKKEDKKWRLIEKEKKN